MGGRRWVAGAALSAGWLSEPDGECVGGVGEISTERRPGRSPASPASTPARLGPAIVKTRQRRKTTGHAVVAGRNYGQGSSREHAAVAPRAKGFARIHRQNLINYGILPLVFVNLEDYDRLRKGDVLQMYDLRRALASGKEITLDFVHHYCSHSRARARRWCWRALAARREPGGGARQQ
jgi:Aconitase C-terminal domain